jgi:hypothetical protein
MMDDEAKKILEAINDDDEQTEEEYDQLSTEVLMTIEGKKIDLVIPVLSSVLTVLVQHRVGAKNGSAFFSKLADEIVEDEDTIRRVSETMFDDPEKKVIN